MSLSATTAVRGLPHDARPSEPTAVRVLSWSVAVPVIAYLAAALVSEWALVRQGFPVLVLWLGAVAITDMVPVRLWGSVVLTMSLPVLLAAGMVYAPTIAGTLAFLGSMDPREFRREVRLGRALHNRAQVALSVTAASGVFHASGGDLTEWPGVALAGLAALAADFVINVLMVTLPMRLMTALPVGQILRQIHGDAPAWHGLGYACLGFMALPLATLFRFVGAWGLVAFLAPIVLARQMFSNARGLAAAVRTIGEKDRSLREVSRTVARERHDERLTVAADLHDEVLQPLYKVHLMGQVLRRDLESGRLLQLDDDLPELLHAAEVAQDAIRGIVRDLKRSSLGVGGLTGSLTLLIRELQAQSEAEISLGSEEVNASAFAQLVVYQVAREALQNAVRHSGAGRITVQVARQGGDLVLVVTDNGRGFRPEAIDGEDHFGLTLMEHRTRSAGGSIVVDSEPGKGTRVRASVPADGF